MIERLEVLTNTNLSASNLIKAINQTIISKTNYYIGVIQLTRKDLQQLDKEIRLKLYEKKFAYISASKQRIYLPRKMLGRGILSVENNAEVLLFSLSKYMEQFTNHRKQYIYSNLLQTYPLMNNIDTTLSLKYTIPENELNCKKIKEAQYKILLQSIEQKQIHSVLYKNMEHDYNITDSSIWLKNNYSAPKEEAILSFLQDRNFNYFSTNQICKLCNNSKNSIDHRATRCKQLLSTSYTHRHGQILKIIYLNIIKRFGFTTNNKLKFCKPVKYLENQSAKIICESKIVVDGYIKNDQPDMVVHDKKNKIITIIEVGVTNKDRLKLTEIQKKTSIYH